MNFQLRVKFLYNGGTFNEIAVIVPADIGDKIAVMGLCGCQVFVDGKISNIAATLKKPELNDFKSGIVGG